MVNFQPKRIGFQWRKVNMKSSKKKSKHPSLDIVGSDGSELSGKRIVLCVAGSVAVYKAIELARLLMRHGGNVVCVESYAATKLIKPDYFKWATGNDVITKLTGDLEHIDVRSFSVFASWVDNPPSRGFIIEQNVKAVTVIHELGHIVDVHGIQGDFADEQNVFSYAKEDRNKIFQVALANKPNDKEKLGYITSYSSNNDLENFADHYAYYVVYPDLFRDEMKNDPLLAKKYEFLRDFIFNDKEF